MQNTIENLKLAGGISSTIVNSFGTANHTVVLRPINAFSKPPFEIKVIKDDAENIFTSWQRLSGEINYHIDLSDMPLSVRAEPNVIKVGIPTNISIQSTDPSNNKTVSSVLGLGTLGLETFSGTDIRKILDVDTNIPLTCTFYPNYIPSNIIPPKGLFELPRLDVMLPEEYQTPGVKSVYVPINFTGIPMNHEVGYPQLENSNCSGRNTTNDINKQSVNPSADIKSTMPNTDINRKKQLTNH